MKEGTVVLGRPNVPHMASANDIVGLVKAAKYKKDPAVREEARAALTEKVDLLVQRGPSGHARLEARVVERAGEVLCRGVRQRRT